MLIIIFIIIVNKYIKTIKNCNKQNREENCSAILYNLKIYSNCVKNIPNQKNILNDLKYFFPHIF